MKLVFYKNFIVFHKMRIVLSERRLATESTVQCKDYSLVLIGDKR